MVPCICSCCFWHLHGGSPRCKRLSHSAFHHICAHLDPALGQRPRHASQTSPRLNLIVLFEKRSWKCCFVSLKTLPLRMLASAAKLQHQHVPRRQMFSCI